MHLQKQEYLFQRIREKLPQGESLVDVVAGLLFISSDSAYRRIRGETGLVLEEAGILCEHFSISLDNLLGSRPNSITFQYKSLNNVDYSFESYLSDILQNLKRAAPGEIIYLTKDIPLFYNFLYKPLFAFRYFFWMKSILQHPDFKKKKFSFDLLPPHIEALGNEIAEAYCNIPSIEIWNTECINSSISQVEYYRDADYFESEKDIILIYQSMATLLDHLKKQAEYGAKFLPGENPEIKRPNFQFFYNRVVLGDNTIIVKAEGRLVLYLAYDVLNYMFTQDAAFAKDILSKIEMLIRRATLLSNTSDRQRNVFFNILLRKLPEVSTISKTIS